MDGGLASDRDSVIDARGPKRTVIWAEQMGLFFFFGPGERNSFKN